MTDQNLSMNDTPQYVIDNLQQLSEEAIQEEEHAQNGNNEWGSDIDAVEWVRAFLNALKNF
ncbi:MULTISPECIES: hypothetical protein [Acinetobacter]|uniref:hypothetical protein n=1 Tax=Acinetobacter TaxID=469 RepID=UPI0010229A5D|nr:MULTISPECIES: hypothetical protein [Acinetobacter]MDM1756545.1 hypothetical protein [Acinetobacter sp. 256-1]MDM1759729.1 hypothetical protein [Acinetobacter sp. 251-1]RYL28281.1 hypothetical protein EWP19_02760 [Acinetobacter piscicola]